MSVPAIALYASPPSSVCSTPHNSSSSSSHGSSEYDFYSRPSSASTSTSPISQKPVAGGLSCLFSSQSVRHASASSSFIGGDELGSLWQDRSEDLCSSLSYSPYSSSFKCRDQSPVSVLQCPVSCSRTLAGGSSRSSPSSLRTLRSLWIGCEMRTGTDRLFHRLVRNALDSCLDYDSPSFPIPGSDELVMDEFTFKFNMEESFAGTMDSCEPYARELLTGAQSRHKIFYEEFVLKAFYEAEKAHRGQMRASGDPYLQHCVETAVLLAKIGANPTVVSAGLLHDALDDSFMTYGDIFRIFGAGVADLVEGVSKLSLLSKLARENNTASKTIEADRLHTMFLAMADARAVLVKLADRLHNMMTLEALPMIKQQRFAKETLEIFTPLANRLGISSWKEQLEDLCFKHLNPQEHRELSYRLIKSSDESMIASAKGYLEQALDDGGVSYHVLSGRHKNLYSIYSKMLKKKLNMEEIHDIHGLRLIVEDEEDCYKALGIVHRLWPKVLRKLKDYIMHPKFNGYQSLHTVVLTEDMVPLEVQIRTKEMHLQAEFGFAAHWRYKEGDCKYSSFVLQMVEWARWVVTWQCETMAESQGASLCIADSIRPPCPFSTHSDDCTFSYTPPQCDQGEPVFIILLENEKMSVQEFPWNSRVIDLMERIGQGSSRWPSPSSFPKKDELRPKLNHKPISNPHQMLKMGDVMELTPTIQDKSLTEYREEMQRMYDRGFSVSSRRS